MGTSSTTAGTAPRLDMLAAVRKITIHDSRASAPSPNTQTLLSHHRQLTIRLPIFPMYRPSCCPILLLLASLYFFRQGPWPSPQRSCFAGALLRLRVQPTQTEHHTMCSSGWTAQHSTGSGPEPPTHSFTTLRSPACHFCIACHLLLYLIPPSIVTASFASCLFVTDAGVRCSAE